MKKILLPLLLVLAGSVALADPPDEDVHRPYIPSRGQLYTQFDLGLNLTFLDGNNEFRSRIPGEGPTTLYQSGNGLAPLLSATIGYEFNQTFGLAFRADYDVRSASNSGVTIDTCLLQDVFGQITPVPIEVDKDYSVSISYLSLSALAKLRFDNLYLFLGPTVSVPLSRDVKQTFRILDSGTCAYFPFTTDSSKEITGSLTSAENMKQRLSFKFGAGYMIPLTRSVSLVPQLAYDLGLTDSFQNAEINTLAKPGETEETTTLLVPTVLNPKIRLSSLQATIGIRVNL